MQKQIMFIVFLAFSTPSVFGQKFALLVGANTAKIISPEGNGLKNLKLGVNLGTSFSVKPSGKSIFEYGLHAEWRRYTMNLQVRTGGLGAGSFYDGIFTNHALYLSPSFRFKIARKFKYGMGFFYERLFAQWIEGTKSSFVINSSQQKTGRINERLFPNSNMGLTLFTQYLLNSKNSALELSVNYGLTELDLNRRLKERTAYMNLSWLIALNK